MTRPDHTRGVPAGPWSDRIAAASDERARRELLGEIGLWRAKRLIDVPAQRQAAWALSELYHLLGQKEQAMHEAQQLLSLCQAPPEAHGEERRAAELHLAKVRGREPRPARESARAPRDAGRADEAPRATLDGAIGHARGGRWAEARAALGEPRGPRGALVELWIALGEAADAGGADADALRGWAGRAAAAFGGGSAPTSVPAEADGPLAALLGGPVPTRREALLDRLDAFAAAHPEQVDALADAALADHVATHGEKAPAPWLATTVARALVAGGAATRARVDTLAAEGAWAVTCYAEPAFVALVEVAKAADGWRLGQLRRGVLTKGEPTERRLWTLRLVGAPGEVLVAAAPPSQEPWDDRMAALLARRLVELAPRAALIAEGDGNAALRAAAMVLGVRVFESGDAAEVVAALAELPRPKTRAPKAERSAEAPRAGEQEASPRPDRGPGPIAAIAALFEGSEDPTAEQYAGPLAELRRVFKAFAPVRRAFAAMAADVADRRLATVLRAVHAAAPAGVRLAEGTALAIQGAAAMPGGEVAGLLEGAPESERYGGPGVAGLVQVVRDLGAAGVTLDRVLLGLSRREREKHAALATLPAATPGLWRLLVALDGRRGELWYVDSPTPEAVASAIQLAGEPHPRCVILVGDAASALDAVVGDAVVDGVDAAVARMREWPVSAAVAADTDES